MIDQKAIEFQRLHTAGNCFIMANAWNAGSAVLLEQAGFSAIGTTSAGIAYTLGYPDGEDISFDDLCLVVKQITKRISIPLSVDFERGYGKSIEEVKENVKKIIWAGAVGINFEDGLLNGKLENLEEQTKMIKAISELKEELDLPFVINARTCAYWLNVADEESKLAIAIERGNAFYKAGADCIFIPGPLNEMVVEILVQEIDAPLNMIANPIFNDFDTMNKIGVKRLTMGSGAVRSVFNHLIKIGDDYKAGQLDLMTKQPFSYAEANKFFSLS